MLPNNEKINTALNKLGVDSKPLWGKMSAQHMVEHLILSYRISNDTIKVKIESDEKTLPTLKRFLLSDKPLPKLFINPIIGENLLPLELGSIKSAKEVLLLEMTKYEKHFRSSPESTPTHPIFGNLNKTEWDIFHKKHIEHHFAQFGFEI
jgi:hypothetical protein